MRQTALLVGAILLGDRAALAQVPGGPTFPSSFSTPAAVAPALSPRAVPGQAMPAPGPPPALPTGGSQSAGDPQPAGTAQPAEEVVENIRSFEHMAATLSWVNKHWQVVAGGTVLKDFGSRDLDARLALRLIHTLRLNGYGTVGTPHPVMEYWLSDGQAPQGLTPGLRVLPIDLESLRVEQIQSQWCLRDGQRILFNFGLHPAEARQALAILKKYGFNRLGVIGQAIPSMLVFFHHPNEQLHVAHHPPATRFPNNPHTPPQAAGAAPAGSPADRILARFPGAGVDSVVTPAVPPLQTVSHSAHRDHGFFRDGSSPGFHEAQAPHAVPAQVLPGMDDPAERVPIDWHQVQARPDNGAWSLAAGNHVLARFANERDAHLARGAMHYYRFTEHCHIGGPNGGCSYFLVNGQAPRGVMLGAQGVAFQPEDVAVQQVGGDWAVCAGNVVLARFGDKADDARRLQEAVRRFGFDHLCHIGSGDDQGLTFFVRGR